MTFREKHPRLTMYAIGIAIGYAPLLIFVGIFELFDGPQKWPTVGQRIGFPLITLAFFSIGVFLNMIVTRRALEVNTKFSRLSMVLLSLGFVGWSVWRIFTERSPLPLALLSLTIDAAVITGIYWTSIYPWLFPPKELQLDNAPIH